MEKKMTLREKCPILHFGDLGDERGKLVVIVNGKPRAGKDTFAQLLNRYERVYKI